MFKDSEMISKQTHELNYVLKKYEKKQSEANREKMIALLDGFIKFEEYKPHMRKEFYQYIEDKNAFDDMEK
ncbi:MAG: hypothetical protein L3J70_11435 [Gammaproteobacteria bacterium]|nr:hypothetical protein [Gammaproteobacteria bacterium]